ncbi:C40 family peptidase [Pedococcus sp. 2YAF34]|uniref:C40 family peptidase n=1 Tax=Pedococcus sp. 2YAF34 TaxID=3233032 RepID=UPI003F94395F
MGSRIVVTAVTLVWGLALTACAGPSRPTPSTLRPATAATATTTTSGSRSTTTHDATAGPSTSSPRSSAAHTSTSPRTHTTTASAPSRTSSQVTPRAGHSAWVAVSVATLWRSWSSPRAVDQPALRAPADIRGWLAAMTLSDRRGLQGRADTQALLGDRVLVVAISGTWAKVVVPDQPTPLDARGYPGWLPLRQLSAAPAAPATEYATVVSRTAWLRTDSAAATPVVEISYGTRLPVLAGVGSRLRVGLPGGMVRRVDAGLVARRSGTAAAQPTTGASLVQSAQAFTGLPYLWAGRSGFGFDCSGLTSLVHRVHGVVVPRDADAQATRGTSVSSNALRAGDLLFYATASGYVHHVSMYAGGGLMVQSPATGQAVQTIPVATPSYAAQFAGARRYLP